MYMYMYTGEREKEKKNGTVGLPQEFEMILLYYSFHL